MKKLGLHRGVYVEGLRNLSTLGWLSLILTAVFCSLPHALEILQNGVWDANVYNESAAMFYNDVEHIFPVLYALPFLLPVVFAAKLFAFQNNRRDSDFYHSLPVTRSTLHLSLLAAVATWCAVVVIGSSLVVFPLGALAEGPLVTKLSALAEGPLVTNVFLAVAGTVVSCLFVASVVFLGYTLSGNTMSALFASAILLFVPTAISVVLAAVMASDIQVIRMMRLQLTNYQLLYGWHESLAAWIVTVAVTLLCLGLGLWVGARRPSETAGQSSITPKLQHLFRLLAAFTMCLWPIADLYQFTRDGRSFWGYEIAQLMQWYLVALAVYFLFELITTRKVKNLVKAIPWLGVLAAMNVVCLLGMHATVFAFNAADKAINGKVSWVQVVEPLEYWRYDKNAAGGTNLCYRPYRDSIDPFEEFREDYVASACDTVKIDSSKVCDIAEKALERAIRYRDADGDHVDPLHDMANRSSKSTGYIYQVELRLKVGAFTRERVVYLYDDEMESLIKHIDVVVPVPRTGWITWI